MAHTDPAPADTPSGSERDWWVISGMTIAAASAAVASFSGLYGLAVLAGWPVRLAWLLPLTLDAYAMTSARVWLGASTRSSVARRFARANALGAISMSIAGNAAYHAVQTGLLTVSWPIVVLVGAVPAAVLGLTAHLHALRGRIEPEASRPGRTEDATQDRTEYGTDGRTDHPTRERPPSRSRRRPRYRTEDELLSAARAADAKHREQYGRPITRDGLRAALRISGGRATELRRRLASETGEATEPAPSTEDPTTHPGEEVMHP
jgi:hypothetical protein